MPTVVIMALLLYIQQESLAQLGFLSLKLSNSNI